MQKNTTKNNKTERRVHKRTEQSVLNKEQSNCRIRISNRGFKKEFEQAKRGLYYRKRYTNDKSSGFRIGIK